MRQSQSFPGATGDGWGGGALSRSIWDGTGAAAKPRQRWGIVLSGGEGRRMQPLISDWLGENRPTQYCTFVGSRSMLQHTLDRACSVVRRQNVLTVTGPGHRRHLAEAVRHPLPGRVIEQPMDAGTVPAVFLAATYALLNDPEATLVLFPAGHFVHPEDAFCALANRAAELSELHRDRIFLIGAVPDSPETDYGWVGTATGQSAMNTTEAAPDAMSVAAFRDKPGPAEAGLLWREGYLWNTMVLAVRAKTLWELGRKHLPEMMSSFDALLMVLRAIRQGLFDPKCEPEVLARLYEHLTPADFSRDLLQHAASDCLLLPMRGIHWSDWERPERVTETLARLGRLPLFSGDNMHTEAVGGRLQTAEMI